MNPKQQAKQLRAVMANLVTCEDIISSGDLSEVPEKELRVISDNLRRVVASCKNALISLRDSKSVSLSLKK